MARGVNIMSSASSLTDRPRASRPTAYACLTPDKSDSAKLTETMLCMSENANAERAT